MLRLLNSGFGNLEWLVNANRPTVGDLGFLDRSVILAGLKGFDLPHNVLVNRSNKIATLRLFSLAGD